MRVRAVIATVLAMLGLLVGAGVRLHAAPAVPPGASCWDPEVRARFEAVFDRHRVTLREARNRVEDARYALRRLLTSAQPTRAQLDAQAAQLGEALAALARARAAFLWDLREALPAERRAALMRCFVGPGPGFGRRWRR